ncbi:sugar ABC transporter ATP-binding protein [Chakrabartyella piscis]|uniref:sugar ABC transporter ATP-binding protein n=1 Tax=Chakrabartyella piscis TaxID=2918914 RepID=UPI002958B149|nr:sugar ABC transporter ATP-binding protein [Chakrabartyella piscis]
MGNSVEFRNISKIFPGVKALDDISFKAESGQVYAFLGENGAGKSTLLKILNGDYQPDGGQYLINDMPIRFQTPKEALAHGVSVIYQERQILLDMTVAENVFLGDWPKGKFGEIDFEAMNQKTKEIATNFGLDIEPDMKVGMLSIAHQQMVEIMKAVVRDSKIIAFDEPTASLSDKEIDILFEIIERLKQEGKVIFYVSHRMNEIAQIAQKVIVFKDGTLVDVVDQATTSEDELIRLMVGRSLGDIFNGLPHNETFEEVLLEVDEMLTPYVNKVSFKIHKGEILGFAGLVGSGRTETMNALFGLNPMYSGKIILEGEEIRPKSPAEALEYGFAMVPEDRKMQGILPNISVRGNITISMLKKLINKIGFIKNGEEEIAQEMIQQLNIKTPNSDKLILQLSGGNQQKVILARWLKTNPKVLVLDEPTKGIDVGAKSEFYRIITECAQKGMAVIVISSELPEIIGISDRILVMREGRISGELLRKDFSEEQILKYAMASPDSEAV